MKLYDPVTTAVIVVGLVLIFAQFFNSDETHECQSFIFFGKNMQINCERKDTAEETE